MRHLSLRSPFGLGITYRRLRDCWGSAALSPKPAARCPTIPASSSMVSRL